MLEVQFWFIPRDRDRDRDIGREREREREECIECACLCMPIVNACVLYHTMPGNTTKRLWKREKERG